MDKPSSIVICRETYRSQDEFENAIKKAVMLLLENNYDMTVRYEEPGLGIVVIEFDLAAYELGGLRPVWVTQEWLEEAGYYN